MIRLVTQWKNQWKTIFGSDPTKQVLKIDLKRKKANHYPLIFFLETAVLQIEASGYSISNFSL